MGEVEYLSYDGNVDHLTIYKANEKIISNIDTGLAILSLNKNKEIVGIEFMGANSNFKIPIEVLKHLTSCKVEIRYNPSKKLVIINVLLKYERIERPIVYSYEDIDLGRSAFTERFACSAA